MDGIAPIDPLAPWTLREIWRWYWHAFICSVPARIGTTIVSTKAWFSHCDSFCFAPSSKRFRRGYICWSSIHQTTYWGQDWGRDKFWPRPIIGIFWVGIPMQSVSNLRNNIHWVPLNWTRCWHAFYSWPWSQKWFKSLPPWSPPQGFGSRRPPDFSALEARSFDERSRKHGTTSVAHPTERQWVDTIDCNEASINQSSEEPTGRYHSIKIEEMISHLAGQIWHNPSNMYYILSVLRAQLWASIICDDLDLGHWGLWHQQLTRLLTYGGV